MTQSPDDAGAEDVQISCTSFLWIYASDPREFEARRAIANIARRESMGVNDLSPPSDPVEILSYIEACKDLSEAISRVLQSLVGEARSRGVRWEEIGNALNVGATAAQKRFKGVKTEVGHIERLEGRSALLVAAINQAFQLDFEGRVDEEDRDIPPSWFLRSAFLNLQHVAEAFHFEVVSELRANVASDKIFEMPQEWWDVLNRTRNRLYFALCDLVRTGAVGAISDTKRFWPATPYVDSNPSLYLSYACYQGLLAFELLRLLDKISEVEDAHLYANIIKLTDVHLKFMVEAMVRPECLLLIQEIIRSIDSGKEDPCQEG
jgi:hypothetical protein